MAIGWLTLLKAVPWNDVINNAPKIADNAKSLLRSIGKKTKRKEGSSTALATLDPQAARQIQTLANRLTTMETRVDGHDEDIQSLLTPPQPLIPRTTTMPFPGSIGRAMLPEQQIQSVNVAVSRLQRDLDTHKADAESRLREQRREAEEALRREKKAADEKLEQQKATFERQLKQQKEEFDRQIADLAKRLVPFETKMAALTPTIKAESSPYSSIQLDNEFKTRRLPFRWKQPFRTLAKRKDGESASFAKNSAISQSPIPLDSDSAWTALAKLGVEKDKIVPGQFEWAPEGRFTIPENSAVCSVNEDGSYIIHSKKNDKYLRVLNARLTEAQNQILQRAIITAGKSSIASTSTHLRHPAIDIAQTTHKGSLDISSANVTNTKHTATSSSSNTPREESRRLFARLPEDFGKKLKQEVNQILNKQPNNEFDLVIAADKLAIGNCIYMGKANVDDEERAFILLSSQQRVALATAAQIKHLTLPDSALPITDPKRRFPSQTSLGSNTPTSPKSPSIKSGRGPK